MAEATGLVDLANWPSGCRLILRKERPHPGAQLTFTDANGMRITAIITDRPRGAVWGQVAGDELWHRRHARVEDRIRDGKNTGLKTSRAAAGTKTPPGWVLAPTDLVTWAKLICFTDVPDLAKCEIAAFRYRVLHVAARITRSARRLHLRIDQTWRWATHIAEEFHRLRAAPI